MQLSVSIGHSSCGIDGGVSFDGNRFHRSHPKETWWIDPGSRQVRDLSEVMPAFGVQPPSIVSQAQRSAFESLTCSPVPWLQALGKDRYLSAAKRAWNDVNKWINENPEYVEFLLREREVLCSLSPAMIDIREFESRRNSPSVESFAPGSGGYSQVPKYSHATQTGRLKVVEGPKILTVSKPDRRVISSRFSGGRILQVDFVSLEPRVALYTAGQDPGAGDVYEWIASSIGMGLTRSKVKVPTLSVLYGQSARNDDSVSSTIREKIQSLFKIHEMKERIASGKFSNGFGRPLETVEDRLLISHYTQSTAVDVALLGFRNLLESLGLHVGAGIVPIFVLHDALILDVSPELYGFLKGKVDEGVIVDRLGHFPLSLGPIWDE